MSAGCTIYSTLIYHWAIMMNWPWWIFGHFWLLKFSIKNSRELEYYVNELHLSMLDCLEGHGVQTEAVENRIQRNSGRWCSVSLLQIWCWSLCLWNLTGCVAIRQGHTLCSLSICHEQILLKIRKIRFPTVWTLTSLWDLPWSSSKQLLREYVLRK